MLYIDTQNLDAKDEIFINGNSLGSVETFDVGYPSGTIILLPGKYSIGLGSNGKVRTTQTLLCYREQDCKIDVNSF